MDHWMEFSSNHAGLAVSLVVVVCVRGGVIVEVIFCCTQRCAAVRSHYWLYISSVTEHQLAFQMFDM